MIKEYIKRVKQGADPDAVVNEVTMSTNIATVDMPMAFDDDEDVIFMVPGYGRPRKGTYKGKRETVHGWQFLIELGDGMTMFVPADKVKRCLS